MNNIVFIIPAGFIRYSVVSALEVIRCSCSLVMNNEFKTNARSKYICKFELPDRLINIYRTSNLQIHFDLAFVLNSLFITRQQLHRITSSALTTEYIYIYI